jgi:hypothetical protein
MRVLNERLLRTPGADEDREYENAVVVATAGAVDLSAWGADAATCTLPFKISNTSSDAAAIPGVGAAIDAAAVTASVGAGVGAVGAATAATAATATAAATASQSSPLQSAPRMRLGWEQNDGAHAAAEAARLAAVEKLDQEDGAWDLF